jgi:hypothetical protein
MKNREKEKERRRSIVLEISREREEERRREREILCGSKNIKTSLSTISAGYGVSPALAAQLSHFPSKTWRKTIFCFILTTPNLT